MNHLIIFPFVFFSLGVAIWVVLLILFALVLEKLGGRAIVIPGTGFLISPRILLIVLGLIGVTLLILVGVYKQN